MYNHSTMNTDYALYTEKTIISIININLISYLYIYAFHKTIITKFLNRQQITLLFFLFIYMLLHQYNRKLLNN